MSNPLSKFLSEVLGTYGTSITSRTVERDILTHPDYPSIRCISDALDGWKINPTCHFFPLKISKTTQIEQVKICKYIVFNVLQK